MKWFIVLAVVFSFSVGELSAQVVTASASAAGPARPVMPDDAVKGTAEAGLGFTAGGFRSSPFNSLLIGLNTTVACYFRDHLAVEGSTTSAFEVQSSHDSDVKFLFYGAGVKLNWGNRKVQPFVHVLLGGVHLFPQTAYNNSGFAVDLGGGVEKRLGLPVWLRLEGDYLHSEVLAAGQNNLQCIVGLYYRF